MWEPFGTLPANSTAYWKPTPSERGTFGILSTCILTLLLCVYTCLHPNIPPHDITQWYQKPWAVKALGILVGLLAPELVAFLAFRQWLWARKLEAHMKKRIDKFVPETTTKSKRGIWSRMFQSEDAQHRVELTHLQGDPENPAPTDRRKRNRWTRTHSHFALMGGFAFEADNSHTSFIPRSYTRLTLTPSALRTLAEVEPMLIPDLSDADLGDKSKADWLAKTLACLQACWFVAQVVGRAATSAPLSLLEMNTFLHALCCVIVYLAWWSKPLDIGTPELIKIDTEHRRKVFAWLILNSKLGARRFLDDSRPKPYYFIHGKDIDKDDRCTLKEHSFIHLIHPSIYPSGKPVPVGRIRAGEGSEAAHLFPFTMGPGQMLNGFYCVLRRCDADSPDVSLTLDSETLECLRLADLLRADSGAENTWSIRWTCFISTIRYLEMTLPHITDFYDFPNDDELHGFIGSSTLSKRLDANKVFWAILLGAGSIYGVVHLTAWNGPFTSLLQRWMWRVACIIVASPAAMVILATTCYKLYKLVRRKTWAYFVFTPLYLLFKLIRWIIADYTMRGDIILSIVWGLTALVYLAARVFLLAECFINISQLPPEVYQTPQWSQYIPHLGAG